MQPVSVTPARPDPSPEAPSETSVSAAFRRGPDRRIDVGHSRLAYWRFGHGPDLVFVHGWPLSAATFRRIIPRLAGDFTCHLVDLPGAGQTEYDRDAPIDLIHHAETMRAAIDALGLSSYAFVAHDSGGFIARLVAADDPRVRGLVMGNTEIPGHNPWQVVTYALMGKMPGGTRLLRLLMRSRLVRRSPLGFAGCFQDVAYADGDFHELFVEPLLRPGRIADGQMRLLQTVKKSHLARLPAAHARITAPVQLIWGTDDPFFPLKLARPMLGQFGGKARLDEIAGGKLFAHEDRPTEWADLARPFLHACF